MRGRWIFIALLLTSAVGVFGQVKQVKPQVALSVQTASKSYEQGHDIRVDVVAKNLSEQPVSIFRARGSGGEAEAASTIEVRDGSGKLLPRIDARKFEANGRTITVGKRWGSRSIVVLQSGEEVRDYTILNRLFNLSAPGTYSVDAFEGIPSSSGKNNTEVDANKIKHDSNHDCWQNEKVSLLQGMRPLSFSGLTYPADFPEKPGNPTDCTSSVSLVAGASCALSIDFTPASPSVTQPAVLNENVTVTTNTLNAGTTTQSVAVSGTEGASVATVALSAPVNVATVGASITFAAAAAGQTGVATPTGSATFYSNRAALGTAPLNNGTATYSATFASVGSFLITATYSGDQNYPSATSNSMTEQIVPASTFGTQNIGSSNSQTVTITFARGSPSAVLRL